MYERLLLALRSPDAAEKASVVQALRAERADGRADPGEVAGPPVALAEAGRPERPLLVPARAVKPRSAATPEGRAGLLHAIAHIEFNAINLALDAAYRFRGLPAAYYDDWLRVAAEEAEHFALLRGRLRESGRDYGDFPAHNGLWEMAVRTAHDPLVRMALVPRVLEARGLDATPGIMARLRAAGDNGAVAILERILRDEVGHVEIGTRWFRWLCGQRGVDPDATFGRLLAEYRAPRAVLPLNLEARRAAGFGDAELALIASLGHRVRPDRAG